MDDPTAAGKRSPKAASCPRARFPRDVAMAATQHAEGCETLGKPFAAAIEEPLAAKIEVLEQFLSGIFEP